MRVEVGTATVSTSVAVGLLESTVAVGECIGITVIVDVGMGVFVAIVVAVGLLGSVVTVGECVGVAVIVNVGIGVFVVVGVCREAVLSTT